MNRKQAVTCPVSMKYHHCIKHMHACMHDICVYVYDYEIITFV